MEGWKSNFLSYEGIITLVKAVLSAIPIHFMQAAILPKGVINQIDKLRRNFLWKGNDTCKGINCLVNWKTVCALKNNGGMGIISLGGQNQALLVKWLWRLQKDRQGLWTNTMAQLYDLTEASQLREAQYQCSPFLKELSELVPFFACSVTTDAATMDLQRKWTISGAFSCSSAYHTMQESGIISMCYKVLWKLRVPMKIKILIWLMIEDKILTQEVLTSRGCEVVPGCVLCRGTQVETRDHMLAN